MAKEDKTKNNKKRTITIILTTILILIIVISVAVIIYIKNTETKPNLIDDIQVNVVNETAEEVPAEPVTPEGILKLEELQNENSDIKAYIEIEGTNISYPVLQASDNNYYMNRNYKKEYSEYGSIFLDKDDDLELPSTNFLMYGHNNKNGSMFADLLNYKDEGYFHEHPTVRFITNTEEAEYDIIAAFYSRVYYKSEKNVFRYYYFINADNEKEFDDYVNNCKKASIYDTGKTADYGDQLITLSTCAYHTEDGRFVVVARKANKENLENTENTENVENAENTES